MDEEEPEVAPFSACGPDIAADEDLPVTQQTQSQDAASSLDHQAAMALASTIRPDEWMQVFENIMGDPGLAGAMLQQMTMVLQHRGEELEQAEEPEPAAAELEQAEEPEPAAAAYTEDMS
jgi:hypothetical protein